MTQNPKDFLNVHIKINNIIGLYFPGPLRNISFSWRQLLLYISCFSIQKYSIYL